MTEVILEDNIESLWSLDKTMILDDIRMLGTKASISPRVPEKTTIPPSISTDTLTSKFFKRSISSCMEKVILSA
jgi:hypothetical protein